VPQSDPSSTDPVSTELHVDTGTLSRFGHYVRAELDGTIAPMATSVSATLTNGAMVGTRIPSADVEAMNSKHGLAVDQMAEQLQSYTANMAIIADAAAAIASRYGTSDALAASTIDGIGPALDTAIGSDTPPFPATAHGATV